MRQPMILLMHHLTNEQLHSLKVLTPTYQLVLAEDASSINLDDVEIMVNWQADLGQKILNSPTSRLKWIQGYSAGVDDLPLDKLKEKKILLSNASGVHGIPITETVIGMLLAHNRGLQTAIKNQEKKKWNSRIPASELNHQSLLIVGTGAIGRQLAKVAVALGMSVYGINRSGYQLENFTKTYSQSDIDQILPKMDIVVNILPLTSDTHYFYDDKRFNLMKDGVVFINVGRGPSVNTSALIAACQSGKISFAGIDVFEDEPLPIDSPLWQLDNVLITPHIAGKTTQYDRRFFEIFSENLSQYLTDGTLRRNQVKLDQGY